MIAFAAVVAVVVVDLMASFYAEPTIVVVSAVVDLPASAGEAVTVAAFVVSAYAMAAFGNF